MGRRRKPEDAWMPDNVYRHPRYYIYKPPKAGKGKTIILGGLDLSKADVYRLAELKKAEWEDSDTVRALFRAYFASADFASKAPRTRADREKESVFLLTAFGGMAPDAVEPSHMRRYMDLRGVKSRTQANHEHACMSAIFSWGYERGMVKRNPCKGVKKFTANQRDRYITDSEYQAIYDAAPNYLRVAMEIAYLCAARVGDILSMRWGQVLDEGIYIQQSKTGKRQIKAWTHRLRKAFDLAKSLPAAGVASTVVICNNKGSRIHYRTLNQAWTDAREQAGITGATFHDLKAKGISDYEGTAADKQQFSGHKTIGQVAVYDRKVKITPTLDVE